MKNKAMTFAQAEIALIRLAESIGETYYSIQEERNYNESLFKVYINGTQHYSASSWERALDLITPRVIRIRNYYRIKSGDKSYKMKDFLPF